MEWEQLLHIVGHEPVFETGLLLAGDVDPAGVYRQLSRWVRAGRLYQLRRGLYALAPPYQKVRPHPYVVAGALVPGSYVSLQSALSEYGLIPEMVPQVTSVSAARPGRWDTPFGTFLFHHIKPELVYGYHAWALGGQQRARIARPEKALLDLVYLTPGGDSLAYLRELRLQQLERLDLDTLQELAVRADSPKLLRAADRVALLVREEHLAYELL